MKIRLMTTACLLLVAAKGTLAQHWTVNARAWQYDMTAYMQLKVNGQTVSDYAGYEVAAFCGDECRSVAKVLTVEGETPLLYLRIRSNATGGETITFRVYQASTGEEVRLEESIEFEAQAVAGTPGEPIVLTLGNGLKGDVNGDGAIKAQDASLIQQYVARKFGDDADGFNAAAADVNGDGEVTAQDASLIQQYAARKITW